MDVDLGLVRDLAASATKPHEITAAGADEKVLFHPQHDGLIRLQVPRPARHYLVATVGDFVTLVQAMHRRALEIIDMDSSDRAVREFQPDLSYVLYIHLKRGDMSVERPQRFHVPEQVAQVIQWMGKRDDHTSAKVGAGCVTLAVVLPWMPLRQVFAPMGMYS